MATGVIDNIAPSGIILPRHDTRETAQIVSGAIWISGQTLMFFPYDGGAKPFIVTAAEI